jgi:hypothetical protein
MPILAIKHANAIRALSPLTGFLPYGRLLRQSEGFAAYSISVVATNPREIVNNFLIKEIFIVLQIMFKREQNSTPWCVTLDLIDAISGIYERYRRFCTKKLLITQCKPTTLINVNAKALPALPVTNSRLFVDLPP